MSAFRTTLCLLALAALPGLAMAAEDGDAKEGEEVFRARCRQCHQVGPEAKMARVISCLATVNYFVF